MQPFEFHIAELMHFPFGVVVCGRCGDTEFEVGDVFTELGWSQSEQRESSLWYERVAAGTAGSLRLQVEEISAWGLLNERLSPGCTAGIRFSGSGLEALADIDFADDFRAGKSWSLWGQR